MIEIFRFDKNWRIVIRNETLQFENEKQFKETLNKVIELKKRFEPYK